jgi:predicted PurR-regulated permease PerM
LSTFPPKKTNTPGYGTPDHVEFVSRLLITIGTVLSVLLIVILIWHAVQVLLWLFAGTLLAILLRGLSDWVAKWTRISVRWSFVLVLLLIILTMGLSLWLATPYVIPQVEALVEQLTKSIQQILEMLDRNESARGLVGRVLDPERTMESMAKLLSGAIGLMSTTASAVAGMIMIFFIGLYLGIDPHIYIEGFLHLIPIRKRKRAREVIQAAGYTLRWWLIGRILVMIAVGVLSVAVLWLLGVRLALILGILAGLLNFIPFIGPIAAAIPAALIAMLDGPMLMVYVILFYILIQQFESYVIDPIVTQKTVFVPPVLYVSAQVLMGFLTGILGVALATPLVALIVVLVKMLYVEEIIGEDMQVDGAVKE